MNIVNTCSYKLHSGLPTGNASYILLGYLAVFSKALLQLTSEKLAQLLQVRENLMKEEEQ